MNFYELNISELFVKILEKLETLSDDVKYLMLCNQNVNKDPEERIANFNCCETVEDLKQLENSLSQEKTFRSTVSTYINIMWIHYSFLKVDNICKIH